MVETSLTGVWLHTPQQFTDERGLFAEAFQQSRFAEAVGLEFDVRQVNTSVSRLHTLRGVHFTDVPPGQAKYVTCPNGAILDVAVDLRVGSPQFGQHVAVRLDSESRNALYIPAGFGHAFCALSESATALYLCSLEFAPGIDRGIDPLDPDLALPWPAGIEFVMSDKDRHAPSLATALEQGLLPEWEG